MSRLISLLHPFRPLKSSASDHILDYFWIFSTMKVKVAMSKFLTRKSCTIFLLMMFASCTSVPRFTSVNDSGGRGNSPASQSENTSRYSNLSEVLETETGIASYYADDFHGRLTFTEEVYDMNGTTAAHPTYPMNTIIRVTNLSNNKQITVRINDRMPKHPDRIIDLSLGTARELDMLEDGLAEVKIEVLKWGE
jgi:rare lipoprotein A (peptidoglycan hydrolase)